MQEWLRVALKLAADQLASPQTSFGVRSSRIHFWMRGERTPKDVCGEATDQSTYEDERMKAQGEGEEGEWRMES